MDTTDLIFIVVAYAIAAAGLLRLIGKSRRGDRVAMRFLAYAAMAITAVALIQPATAGVLQ